MKKFITLFIIAIVAMTACTSQVAKDLRQVVGDDIKVVSVKSVDVKTDFYTYTNEYTEVKKAYEGQLKWTREIGDMMRSYKEDMEWYRSMGYTTSYKRYKTSYESCKKDWEEACNRLDALSIKEKAIRENGSQTGTFYIAKLKCKNEFTGKYNNFNGYRIFAYDSDGSIHEVDSGKDMQMICAVFPEAKKDIKKVLEAGLQMFADALSDL